MEGETKRKAIAGGERARGRMKREEGREERMGRWR